MTSRSHHPDEPSKGSGACSSSQGGRVPPRAAGPWEGRLLRGLAGRVVGAARGLLAAVAPRPEASEAAAELRDELRLTREVLGRLVDSEAEQLVALQAMARAQVKLAEELDHASERVDVLSQRLSQQELRCRESSGWLTSVDSQIGSLRERLDMSLALVQREVRSAGNSLESRAEQQATRLEQTALGARVALEGVTTALRSLEEELGRQLKQTAASLPRAVSEGTAQRLMPVLQATGDAVVQRVMPAVEDSNEATLMQLGDSLGQLQESLQRLEEAARQGSGMAEQLGALDDALRQLRDHTDAQLRRVDEHLGRLSEAVRPLENSYRDGWRN